MPRRSGQTMTIMFITSGWPTNRGVINAAYREFTENGWTEHRNEKARFRCVYRTDADIKTVRRAAKKNPGMIFMAFTSHREGGETIVHLGIGGLWMTETCKLSAEMAWQNSRPISPYCRTFPAPKRSRAAAEPQSSCSSEPRPQAAVAKKTKKPPRIKLVANKLAFHGRPGEVETCKSLAWDMLPAGQLKDLKYTSSGSEQYMSGCMEFTTQDEPALRVFNRLVARVPAVTVVLEYDDPKTRQPRILRAVDGKIEGSRAN